MKQCKASTSYDQHILSLDSDDDDDDDVREYAEFLGFDANEIDVANIISQLPILIPKFESPPPPPTPIVPSWGSKRRRSALDPTPPLSSSSSQPRRPQSPILQKTLRIGREKETIPKVKPKASSPETPLSFDPSESDGKVKESQTKSSKKRFICGNGEATSFKNEGDAKMKTTKTLVGDALKKREDLSQMVEDLSKRRDSLNTAIEKVKLHYNNLVAYNLELKAKRQKLCSRSSSSGLVKEGEPQLGIIQTFNHGEESGQPTLNQESGQTHLMVNQVVDQTAYGSRLCQKKVPYPNGLMHPLMSYGSESRTFNHVGPVDIPDLNVSVEKTFVLVSPQPFDLMNRDQNRAKAAEARKRRMMKIKGKK